MLLVLTGQLTFCSLDNVYTKEKCYTEHMIRLLTSTHTLKCYNVQYAKYRHGMMTTKNIYQITNLI